MPDAPVPAAAWTAAREGAVVAPADDTGLLSFTGADAAAFLQGQLSSDVKALEPGMGQRSTYNSPKGRMLATLFVARVPAPDADRFVALLSADITEAVRKRLAMFVLRSKVVVADETARYARFGVGGPAAAAAIAAALGVAPARGALIEREGTRIAHLPDGRYVVAAPAQHADAVQAALAAHATGVPAAVWAWLRVRAAVPEITAPTQDLFVAQAANQDALGALDFRKGCYTGQEIVARTHYLGRLKERLHVLACDGPAPAPATKLYATAFGDQACGAVVNSAAQPGGGSLFLAVLRVEAGASPVAIGAPSGPAATLVPLPYTLPEPGEPRGRVRL